MSPRAGGASRRDLLRAAAGLMLAAPALRGAWAQAPAVTPPDFEVPPGACDCHVHVIGDPRRYPMVAERAYTPPQAPVEALMALHRALHIERVVLVQPSIYGTDNRCLTDALRALGARARGIAVVDPYATDRQLDALQSLGVRGARVNLETAGKADPADALAQLWAAAARVSGRDWHIECYTRLSVVAALKDEIGALPVPVVLDHFAGAPAEPGQPGLSALLALLRAGNVYVKLSAPYRVAEPGFTAIPPIVRALVETRPDRLLWASDWPHTGRAPAGSTPETIAPFRSVDDGALFNLFARWVPDAAVRRQILVDNPARRPPVARSHGCADQLRA